MKLCILHCEEKVNVIVSKKTDPCSPLFHSFEHLWELRLLFSLLILSKFLCFSTFCWAFLDSTDCSAIIGTWGRKKNSSSKMGFRIATIKHNCLERTALEAGVSNKMRAWFGSGDVSNLSLLSIYLVSNKPANFSVTLDFLKRLKANEDMSLFVFVISTSNVELLTATTRSRVKFSSNWASPVTWHESIF